MEKYNNDSIWWSVDKSNIIKSKTDYNFFKKVYFGTITKDKNIMLEEQNEAIEVMEEINEFFFTTYGEQSCIIPSLSVTLDGNAVCITLSVPTDLVVQEIELYNSENNQREFIEEINDYESLRTYIIKQINEYQKRTKKAFGVIKFFNARNK